MQKTVLNILQEKDIVSMCDLKEGSAFSERKIRSILKELRQQEVANGFKIKTVPKQGYLFQVVDRQLFELFLEKSDQKCFNHDIAKKDYRISLIIFLLLQNSGYISLDQIAEILEVSRSTVLNDMEEVKEELNIHEIKLIARSGYGIKVQGSEKKIRQLLSNISGDVETQTVSLEFFDFIAHLDFAKETEKFISLLNKYNVVLTNMAIESILFHIKILIYRITQNNYINSVNINHTLIDPTIYKITNEMISFIEGRHNIKITEDEIDLVASQILGKSNTDKVPIEQKMQMEQSILLALQKVDEEYDASFAQDETLIENLLLHIYPLIMRVSFGLSLSNSLVGSISIRYMNAFLVAMRFIDYHSELKDFELSRDEIGYLALHFATHIEKENQAKLFQIKKIVLAVDNRRSSSILLKTKLQTLFPLATILELTIASASRHVMDDIELIITTAPLSLSKHQHKVVEISDLLDEQDIRRIKNEVLLNITNITEETISLQNLFHEELFEIHEDGDYQVLIQNMCDKMTNKGYAKPGFTQSVLERENRFSTIYLNGIASPHSLIQLANIDSIGVILLKNPIFFQEKKVNCIFVLNVKKGHLLLHQEISDFILRLMQDDNKVKLLQFISTYQKFREFIQDIL